MCQIGQSAFAVASGALPKQCACAQANNDETHAHVFKDVRRVKMKQIHPHKHIRHAGSLSAQHGTVTRLLGGTVMPTT